MKNLRYVCAQPAIDYYTWQVEVLINNFLKNGVKPGDMDIVCAIRPDEGVPPPWRKLADHYSRVRFFFYEDTRQNPSYISSVRPHILAKHFAAHPALSEDAIFYHDSDIAFTRPVDWSKFADDDTWYASDCRFYIGAEYIESKKHGIFERMCAIVGIDPEIPRANEANSGGAQYIMKNVKAGFWEKVESDSTRLYDFFVEDLVSHPEVKESDATPARPAYNPIQKWTADMWAVLWNAWLLGHKVQVVPELDFVWATQDKTLWDERAIFHNAGVLNTEADRYFYKGAYTSKLPYDIRNSFAETGASHQYVNEILETAARSCLIDRRLLTEEQIAFAIKQELGEKVDEICFKLGISEPTLEKWRAKFGDAQSPASQRLVQLEQENADLKRLVADLSLDRARLQETLSRKS